jgi:hypothetical protein
MQDLDLEGVDNACMKRIIQQIAPRYGRLVKSRTLSRFRTLPFASFVRLIKPLSRIVWCRVQKDENIDTFVRTRGNLRNGISVPDLACYDFSWLSCRI